MDGVFGAVDSQAGARGGRVGRRVRVREAERPPFQRRSPAGKPKFLNFLVRGKPLVPQTEIPRHRGADGGGGGHGLDFVHVDGRRRDGLDLVHVSGRRRNGLDFVHVGGVPGRGRSRWARGFGVGGKKWENT